MAIQDDAPTEPADFTAEVRYENGATVLSLAGDLDLSTSGALWEVLMLPEVLNAPRVRVDLTRLEFLDSTCISLLVSACKRMRESGGTFSVSCSEGIVLRVLQISGLLDYFQVEGAPRAECATPPSGDTPSQS
jgi:anti-sigma B factor antagonist